MKRNIIALAGLCITLLSGCSKTEAFLESFLNVSKQQTLYSIKYGSHPRNVMDIALPANRNSTTPVVILIHGGAWVMGDKSYFISEIQQFAKAGIACATINYRYASDITNVHHPDLPDDVVQAMNFIGSKASLWKVSDKRFGLAGHSAGGHLALITAYTLNDGRIKACVSWGGPLDFTNSEQLAIMGSKEVFKAYIGTGLNSSNDTLKYRQASPYWMVNSSSVPTLMIHGTNDIGVPYSNAVLMKQKLNSLGVDNLLSTFNDAGHIWTGNTLNDARSITLQWFQLKL